MAYGPYAQATANGGSIKQGQPKTTKFNPATIWLVMLAAILVISLCTGSLSGGLPALTFNSLLSVLQDVFGSLVFSTAALLLMVLCVYRMLPAATKNTDQPTQANPSHSQAKMASHWQGSPSPAQSTASRPIFRSYADTLHQPKTAFKAPFQAKNQASKPTPEAAQQSAYSTPHHTFKESIHRPLPAKPGVPTMLTQHAEVLLKQARTIPNFSTTPLAGQHRVLTKLAANFVPAPQQSAAVTLAIFRLRQPAQRAA